jgi:hypothetical protein
MSATTAMNAKRQLTKPYPKVESTEDFKMRLRVMLGRPAIVSNAPRQKLTNSKYNNENANQGSKTD